MSKQCSTLSKVQNSNAKLVRHCCRFWQQSRTLLRRCCWCGPGLTHSIISDRTAHTASMWPIATDVPRSLHFMSQRKNGSRFWVILHAMFAHFSSPYLLDSPHSIMKLFRTSSANIVENCQKFFHFLPISYLIDIRTATFLENVVTNENCVCKLFAHNAQCSLNKIVLSYGAYISSPCNL